MKLRCAIADDEPLALGLLESYVRRTPFLELNGRYCNGTEALEGIRNDEPDLIFLDIQMPGLNGMDLSRLIGERTRIVFITAFRQYALEGYRVNALDYLLKPVSYPEFLEAADKALRWFRRERQPQADAIYVKSEYRILRIRFADIRYIEGWKDYVRIFTDEYPEPVLSLIGMKKLEEQLPAEEFIRVHRSYIVRKDRIRTVERGRIVFGDLRIPVGDAYKAEFNRLLSGDPFPASAPADPPEPVPAGESGRIPVPPDGDGEPSAGA